MAGARTLVVVGNGMAGHRLCAQLVERGGGGFERVVVFGEEPWPAYDRVHLGNVFAKRPAEELVLAPPGWYRHHGIELRLGDPATRIDLDARRVVSHSGEPVGFEALVMATGSSPVLPGVPGANLPQVFVYRTLDDARAIQRAAERALAGSGRAAVVGGGLLGVEVARAIQRIGCRVEIFERAGRLLPRQLDRPASRVLEARVRELGIDLHLARSLRSIEPAGRGVRLYFPEGATAEFDLVVVAAGVRPRDALAREAGIHCHARGGIEVDDRLRSSAPGVWAVGECARHEGVVYGLASPCLVMAEVAADGLCGQTARFRGVMPATRLKVEGVELSVVGDTAVERTGVVRVTHRDGGIHRSLVLQQGRAIGATAIGAWADWHRVQEAVSRGRFVRPWQRLRLARHGSPWRAGLGVAIERWSDAAPVCSCMGVDCGALRRALAEGCRSAASLSARTGAGTGCGSCLPLLEALAGERAVAVRAGAGRALLVAGIAASALAGLFAFAPPVPLSDSVQEGRIAGMALDRLWRDGIARQLTGFTALAASLASLAFSLRKRLGLLERFSYAGWRGVHGVLGTLALLGIAVHTGLRTGANLDRALLVCFLGVGALGALAGIATSLEARLSPEVGARLRRWSTAAHVAIFGPLPVLVLFHVIKVYWY